MALMVMGKRMMRIKMMMMAVLCFPLTLPPWSELFNLVSCLLKYIQLSSVDHWVLSQYGATTTEPWHPCITLSSSAAEQCTYAYCHFICKQQTAPGFRCTSKSYTIQPVLHMFPLWLEWWNRGLLSEPCCTSRPAKCYTNDLKYKNKWQILVISLPYLSLTLSLSPPAPRATAKSCPLGPLRSGTVRL